jgi:hypothetical protein
MIRAAALTFAAGLLLAAAPAAQAQSALPDSENGRYTFSQSGADLLRLDGRTGQVSLCSKRDVGWSCMTVPDERSALETEITRLQRENVVLKRELMARGIALPGDIREPQPHPSRREETLRLPSEEELNRVTAFIEQVWRRLVDMVQTMQKEKDTDAEKKS